MANIINVGLGIDEDPFNESIDDIQKKAKKQGKKIGKNLGDNTSDSFKDSAAGISKTILAIGATFATVFGGKAIIDASAKQQDAVNALNTSLELAGRFSEEASQDFQQLASDLQSVSTVGDEVTLELAALATNFTTTNEEAQKLTEAAIELSAATGMELESSLKNLGKTTAGLVGELGESIPALRDVSQEALKSGAAIDFVLERFGGAAASKVNTFSGAIAQGSNVFGDLLEVLGDFITKSPVVIELVKSFSVGIGEFIKSITEFQKENGDFVGNMVRQFVEFSRAVHMFLIVPMEFAFNGISLVIKSFMTTIQGAISGFASTASKLVSFFAPDSELATNLVLFKESSSDVLDTFLEKQKAATDGLFNFDFSSNAEGFLNGLSSTVDRAVDSYGKLSGGIQKTNSEIVKMNQELIKSIDAGAKGAATSILKSTSLITQGLVTGQDGLSQFLGVVLNTFGDLLISTGTAAIGIGALVDSIRESLTTFFGGNAILAGVAAIALGGVLKGLGSTLGGSSGIASPGGGGVTTGTSEEGTETANETVETEDVRQQQLVVNIQGDVLDGRESGSRIVDKIKEFVDAEGVDLRFA